MTLLCVSALLPVVAQQQQPAGAMRFLYGRVVSVDANRQLAQVILLSHVTNLDAPGKVPDEMAQQAAALTVQATRLETKGKSAQRLRQQIDKLLHWREIDQTIATNITPLSGVQRVSLDQVTLRMRLRASVSVNGTLADQVVPDHATATKDIVQVGKRVSPIIRRLPAVSRNDSTYFEVVGEVVQLNPLTLAVQGKTIVIATPPQVSFVQQTPITARDLTPGQRIVVRAGMVNDLKVASLNRMLVLSLHSDLPFELNDLVE